MRDLGSDCGSSESMGYRDVDSLDINRGMIHRQIEHALSSFGGHVLTAREQAVVKLILRGLPSKRVAVELKIAVKTEKVHRRNAYAKLGVNSHGALFVQFLKFLSASPDSGTQRSAAEQHFARSTEPRPDKLVASSKSLPPRAERDVSRR